MESADLVVIGAGWYGLAAAKTYHELNPSGSLLVLDSGTSLGGVWSEERLYPGLKSNNMLGTFQFGDYPMDTKTYGVKTGQHIPGNIIHKYLTNYAEHFGIFKKIRFNTKVASAEHQEKGGWILSIVGQERQILANKIIIATGLTSDPARPVFEGMESFGVPLFHPRDFLTNKDVLKSADRVCVLGGAKSAWDVVYAFASTGVKVDWVIRESGHGPIWMAPPYVTPLKKWLEKLTCTRLLSWFSPCVWANADGYSGIRNLLHGTWIGRFVVDGFWSVLKNDVITLNKFNEHPEVAKLKPWSNPFFTASSLSILNYDTNIFDFVRDGTVRVHIADIKSLGPNKVYLSSAEVLPVDALVSCTGWKHSPSLKFVSSGLDLGMPRPISSMAPRLKSLTEQADIDILNLYPRLRNQPPPNPKAKPLPTTTTEDHLTCYQLYRFMVPPATVKYRDIAFAGACQPISTSIAAQTQALWIAAYFSGDLKLTTSLPDEEKMQEVAVLHNRFGKWRYPSGFGAKYPDFVFDTIPYIDSLLADLGLKVWRKKGRIAEWTEAYGPEDYDAIVQEYVDDRRKTK